MASGFVIEGNDRLIQNLTALAKYFRTEAKDVTLSEMRDVANDIAEMARSLAPVDTGQLRDGIKVFVTDNGVEIVSEAAYSIYVEFGTVKMQAQPFFRPAYHAYGLFARLRDRHTREIEDRIT